MGAAGSRWRGSVDAPYSLKDVLASLGLRARVWSVADGGYTRSWMQGGGREPRPSVYHFMCFSWLDVIADFRRNVRVGEIGRAASR